MAQSLGLAAYRALARRSEVQSDAPETARPDGELVWIHAAEPGNIIAVQDLALRLCANRVGLNVLITLPEDAALPTRLPVPRDAVLIVQNVPSEHPTSIATFLQHWQPNLCVWVWGALRPNLILQTADSKCPLILIDADSQGFDGRRDRWLSDMTRTVLGKFDAILTRTETGLRRLVQLGRRRETIEVTSQLLAGGQALHCADTDLADLSVALGGRPVWFASHVLAEEIPIVLTAHRKALRLSHRLLLIVNSSAAQDADAMAQLARDQDLTTIRWGDGAYPDDTTQVMITDDPGDLGLFFRVAPVSFLGSSLMSDKGGADPFEAAALGSAVLYGPKVRDYMPSYTRLAAAGAARIVNDADALGVAVSHLIAADQAAAMAHAGWDVISQGAAMTDRVIDLVQDALDARVAQP